MSEIGMWKSMIVEIDGNGRRKCKISEQHGNRSQCLTLSILVLNRYPNALAEGMSLHFRLDVKRRCPSATDSGVSQPQSGHHVRAVRQLVGDSASK
jgi:hypothetical protein